ncbi:MAG: hypothetical protein V2J65_15850 [Desulfobacteraceae bacterium]|jgi:hypothetical protein|nr:hypothetical protein [Desulfobacteraceae bacterium]
MRTAQFFLMLLLAAAASNALAEVRDAHSPAWTDFKFQTQNLFNVQSPVMPVQIGNDLAVLEEQHLFAQTQAAEQNDSNQSTEKDSALSGANEAARQSSNPLGGDFFILLNQIDNFAMQGDITDETRWINNWAFQPVVPVPMDETIGKHWIWVNRPTFNFVLNADLPDSDEIKSGLNPGGGTGSDRPSSIPPGGLPFDSFSGFGDLYYFTLLGQSLPQERWGGGDFVWAGGLTTVFPTASKDELGGGVYSAGPAGVLAFIGKEFIFGGLGQHWLSYAEGGNGSGDNQNFSWLNVFYFLNFEDGWQVGGTPIITADWEADSDDRWTVPIGLGVYKTSLFGKMPIKLGVEAQYMPISPDAYGQEWNIRFTFAPIIPSFFK